MKGLFEQHPSFPPYTCVWDVRILLNYFRGFPQENLSLKMLTKKLATLLGILAGGQRSQTIHAINVMDIVATPEKCIIPIYTPLKQTRKGKHMKPLEFRVYKEDETLCVVKNLTDYLQRTREHRQSPSLFLSYQRPYHAVTRDTVSRWVNDMMFRAGIDTTKYVTHSCRSAASSFAWKRKVPLRKIVESCGWASERTFSTHYRRDIADMDTIGQHILQS